MIEYTVKATVLVVKEYTVTVENQDMSHEEAEQRGRDYAAENIIEEMGDKLIHDKDYKIIKTATLDYTNL